MKNLLILLFFGYTFNSHAQLTLPKTHMPKAGDTAYYYVDTNIYSPKPLTNGIFDFTDLKKHDSTTLTFLENDNLLDYPNANLKLLVDFIESSSSFFKSTSNDLFLMGLGELGTQLAAFGSPQLNGTLKYMSYPFTNTSNFSTSDKISVAIPGSIIPPELNIDSILKNAGPPFNLADSVKIDSIVLEITINLSVKGLNSGKIKTPIDNNIDVIQIERTITPSFKFLLNGKAYTLFGIVPISNVDLTALFIGQIPIPTDAIKTHSYHSPSIKAEILNATVDSNGKYQTVQYRKKSSSTGGSQTNINNHQIDKISISKNQLNEYSLINILPNRTYTTYVYNSQGIKIKEMKLTSNYNSFELTNLAKGIYYLQVIDSNFDTKSFKLVK